MMKIWLFLGVLIFLLAIGLIPSVVSEERLHNLIYDIYHDKKSNLDIVLSELNKKNYLIKKEIVDENTEYTLGNCNSSYFFVEPVTIIFDIDSKFNSCSTYKEFHDITILSVFSLNGDMECRVMSENRGKSVFLFSDTHRLQFTIKIEEL